MKTAPAQDPKNTLDGIRKTIQQHSFTPEKEAQNALLDILQTPEDFSSNVYDRAVGLVEYMREHPVMGVDSFLQEYKLSTREGVLIMCLAEALLRIPDAVTANRLIEDKFTDADWEKYVGNSESFLVNASSWGLMLTGKVLNFDKEQDSSLSALRKIVHKTGAPVIRQALVSAMEWMGTQFIQGRDIEEAVSNAKKAESDGYTHSYDMLGEGARTITFAEDYAHKYLHAIRVIGKAAKRQTTMADRPGISIKLSALHPRFEARHRQTVMETVVPQLKALLLEAKKYNLIASIDAEEAARLDVTLDVFEAVYTDPEFAGWDGISLVVQTYQKRAPYVIHWLAELARQQGRRIPVRLVKGAYWDTEIKIAQERGLEGYPVFTRKYSTDVSYLACAKLVLEYGKELFYPQFATHNAHTVASIVEMADADAEYEFQRLYGMGVNLYAPLMKDKKHATKCRIYAPVGVHKDLLAYLVRRLLENGANSSFINQLADRTVPVEELIDDPIKQVREWEPSKHSVIPLPKDIYGANRENSAGLDFGYYQHIEATYEHIGKYINKRWHATSIINGQSDGLQVRTIINPANSSDTVGTAAESGEKQARFAIDAAADAAADWNSRPVAERADILRKAANLLQERQYQAMALIMREAGRVLDDVVDEVREAIDFCRYYADQIELLALAPTMLPGPTGESNTLSYRGRGVVACISPWNFPLAIFTGQVAAALAAGNTVIAKPAEQTPIIAWFMVQLLHEAGVPQDVLHLLLGDGATVGDVLTSDTRVAAVVFTGSTEVAHLIQTRLANRNGAIVPFIAETGGQNCMVVDSSALPEQVTDDVVRSAFGSSGQRCSSLRVLFVQQDVSDQILEMIQGALDVQTIGDPWDVDTDIGPVIDAEAKQALDNYKATMERKSRLLYSYDLNTRMNKKGTYVSPAIFEIQRISELKREMFGPILHVIRYKAEHLDDVIDAINSTGYGLTLGIHSRIDETIGHIVSRARVGNIYVNRGMTGAVVGVQPFGGQGLSGTGPKAGGPNYLLRLMTEHVLTTNIAAVGGNVALYSV